jgi:hypothetical protein
MGHKAEYRFVIETPKEVLQIRLQHPIDFLTDKHFIECCQCAMSTQSGSTTKRTRQKVLLVDG